MNTYSTHFPPYPSHDSESESRNTLAQAKRRLVFLGLCYLMGIAMILTRIVSLSNADVVEPIVAQSQTNPSAGRADIADRNGRILATNLITKTLYARPNVILDADKAASGLAQIFPDLDAEILLDKFTNGKSSFLWLKYKISRSRAKPSMIWATLGCCSARPICGFIPTGTWRRTSSAGLVLAIWAHRRRAKWHRWRGIIF